MGVVGAEGELFADKLSISSELLLSSGDDFLLGVTGRLMATAGGTLLDFLAVVTTGSLLVAGVTGGSVAAGLVGVGTV